MHGQDGTETGAPTHHSWSTFVLQIYPASLQLEVLVEGEHLVLLLEKNEWVFLWFILFSLHNHQGHWDEENYKDIYYVIERRAKRRTSTPDFGWC